MIQRLEQYDAILIPCNRIYYDSSFNCRGEFTLQSVKDLADTIIEHGRLLTPIWVQPAVDVSGIPPGFGYRLIAGHRRYKAVTSFLKWTHIPGTVFHDLTDRQAHVLNLVENLERRDLNPLEEAVGMARLYPDGVPIRQAARELKKNTRWVHDRLTIIGLPEEIQQLVAAKRVTLLDLQLIRKHENPDKQIEVARVLAETKGGRGRRAKRPDGLTRSFRRRLNKSEINELIARLLNRGIKGLAPRIAARCAGYLTDEEISVDIDAAEPDQ